jgi:hypothetical protein
VARSHSPDIKNQTPRLTSRKNSTASLAGVDFPIGSFAENSVLSNNEDALFASAHFVFAEGGQWGRLPWR